MDQREVGVPHQAYVGCAGGNGQGRQCADRVMDRVGQGRLPDLRLPWRSARRNVPTSSLRYTRMTLNVFISIEGCRYAALNIYIHSLVYAKSTSSVGVD